MSQASCFQLHSCFLQYLMLDLWVVRMCFQHLQITLNASSKAQFTSYTTLEIWQLNLDCHMKPCEVNACARGVVPARQHQRLPLLSHAHSPPAPVCASTSCPVPSAPSAFSGAWLAGPARNEKCQFSGLYPWPPFNFLRLKPSLRNAKATMKLWRQLFIRVISEQTYKHRPA